MTATNHALTGIVIALTVKQPLLAVPLAFASHFVMDAIPHFDMRLNHSKSAKIVVFTDSLIAGALTIVLSILLGSNVSPWLIFVCAFVCMSPDLVWGWRYYKFRDFTKVITEPMSLFSRFHQKIQWSETRQGGFIELGWAMLMIFVVVKLR